MKLVLKKTWFQAEIDSEPNPEVKLFGERIYLKFIEAPMKGNSDKTPLKDFDRDATYSKVVHFYIDKKGYTKDQAHDMGMQVVNREVERRNLKKC